MENSEPERLGTGDLDGANALVAEAGWNQTGDDWLLFLRAGTIFGFRDGDERVIATAAAIPYGSEFGWISMVLVNGSWRRRGLATRLLDACIGELESSDRVPVLDATPAGEEVYRRVGFVAHFDLRRWQRGPETAGGTGVGDVRAATPDDAPAILARDAEIFGGDRGEVVRDLLTRDGARAWTNGEGHLLSRRGRIARQLGPLACESEDGAIALLHAALADIGDGPVFMDVPDRHAGLVAWLEENGFMPQRPLRRMARGHATAYGDTSRMFALVGPEFG